MWKLISEEKLLKITWLPGIVLHTQEWLQKIIGYSIAWILWVTQKNHLVTSILDLEELLKRIASWLDYLDTCKRITTKDYLDTYKRFIQKITQKPLVEKETPILNY